MTTNDGKLRGQMYLTVRHDFAGSMNRKLKPVKVTGTYPSVVEADQVVIHMNVVLPRSAFLALEGGELEIPEDSLVRHAQILTGDADVLAAVGSEEE